MTAIHNQKPKNLFTYVFKNTKQQMMLQDKKQVLLEGLYIFGGLDDKGRSTNNLHIINTSFNPWTFSKYTALGQPPDARCDHCAEHIANSNLLVIYGGRNPGKYEQENKVTLGTLFVLELTMLVWCNVKLSRWTYECVERYSFSSFVIGSGVLTADSKMYIFGGLNEGQFIDSYLNSLETEESLIQKRGSALKLRFNSKYLLIQFRNRNRRVPAKGCQPVLIRVLIFLPTFAKVKNSA